MKPYFILLAVLFTSNTLLRVWQLWLGVPPEVAVSYLADVACFALCLWAAFALAFDRQPLTRPQARLIYYATMVAGIVSVLLRVWGPQLGVPAVGGVGLVDVGLWALSYVLFAIPAVLYDNWLKTGVKPGTRPGSGSKTGPGTGPDQG